MLNEVCDMKKFSLLSVLLLSTLSVFAQTKTDMWSSFAKTKFEPRYDEKLGEYIFHPNFAQDLKALVGKEITIEGYYVPFAPEDGNYIVISKFPMSQCFFCGGAGPESVAEVNFSKELPKLDVDDLITVKGKLKLNMDDLDHVTFILTDAVLISK
jgi:hypothetical protein